MPALWKAVTEQKRAEQARLIAAARDRLKVDPTPSSDDEEVLIASATAIVSNIRAGEWTALGVVSAYIRQAIRAHEQTNCLTEILFEEALSEAETLDKSFSVTQDLRGRLHGVPVSLKDQMNVKGYDTSCGLSLWSNKPATEDATLVTALREEGAIVIAKTNVPQTMLSFECSNPLFGRTTNPWNEAYTSGGSSGGEAALLASNGSAIGIGSDVGGSLRIPTGYCGLYSLKPGWGRVSKHGAASLNKGFEAIPSVLGPISRSVEDVDLACRVLFGTSSSPTNLEFTQPYRDVTLPGKLKFGYYTSDLFVKASPACRRAVLETVDALRTAGHECIEFETTLAREAMFIFAALSSADGYETIQSHLGSDPKESSLFLVTLGPKLPGFVRWISSKIVSGLVGDTTFATCLDNSRHKSAKEFFSFTAKRDDVRRQWYKEVWDAHGFDGIIAPIQAVPAIPHGATRTLSPIAAATIVYNIIDSPVGVVPVTRVDPSRDALTKDWDCGSEGTGSKLLEDAVFRDKSAPYDPVKQAGMPVGVQIVGKSFEDEKVLAMMKVVDNALGERRFGPRAWAGKSR